MLVKYFLKKIILCFFILVLSLGISFIYNIPYNISLFLLLVIIYSFYSILSELKNTNCKLLKSHKLYVDGLSEKLVDLLLSLNYIAFMITCYMLFIKLSLLILDIFKLITTFFIILISIWIVGHSKKFILKFI